MTSFDLGTQFKERRDIDKIQNVRLSTKEDASGWAENMGCYFTPFTYDQEVFYSFSKAEQLTGTEVVLADIIQKKITERKKLGLTRPIIVIDFGGMLGTTWCRIASHLRKEVEAGEVCFIVTNLHLSKEQIKAALPELEKRSPISKASYDAIENGLDLVEYINCNATELWGKSIHIGGQEIPLKDNVDMLHESLALIHSSTPDLDLPVLGQMLSEGGVLMLGSDRPTMRDPQEKRTQLLPAITAAFKTGLETLNKKLTQLQVGQKGAYNVFINGSETDSPFESHYPSQVENLHPLLNFVTTTKPEVLAFFTEYELQLKKENVSVTHDAQYDIVRLDVTKNSKVEHQAGIFYQDRHVLRVRFYKGQEEAINNFKNLVPAAVSHSIRSGVDGTDFDFQL